MTARKPRRQAVKQEDDMEVPEVGHYSCKSDPALSRFNTPDNIDAPGPDLVVTPKEQSPDVRQPFRVYIVLYHALQT